MVTLLFVIEAISIIFEHLVPLSSLGRIVSIFQAQGVANEAFKMPKKRDWHQ
jgi:hypothetical protein